MRILDRYVIRSFLSSALMLFVAIMALRIVADLFFNMDEFLEDNDTLGGLLDHITAYYGYQSLMYFSELGGVIIVTSAAFTLARMNHTNELTAMLASGVSLHRVILPMVVSAMLMGGLILLDRELLIPPNAARLVRDRDDAREIARFPIYLMPDSRGTIWLSPLYDPQPPTATTPILTFRDDKHRRLASVVSGGVARPASFDGRDGWELTGAALSRAALDGRAPWQNTPDVSRIYTRVSPHRLLAAAKDLARKHNIPVPPDEQIPSVSGVPPLRDAHYDMTINTRYPPNEEELVLGPYRPGQSRGGTLNRPVFTFRTGAGELLGLFHARKATWVPGPPDKSYWQLEEGRFFYPTDLQNEDLVLRQSTRYLDLLTTAKLTRLIQLDRVPDRQAAILAKHVRFADPINNLVMLLLALPFILSRERNIRASASLCVLMVGTYFAFVYICRLIGLPPLIAAFLPILLFGTVSVVMLDAVKT